MHAADAKLARAYEKARFVPLRNAYTLAGAAISAASIIGFATMLIAGWPTSEFARSVAGIFLGCLGMGGIAFLLATECGSQTRRYYLKTLEHYRRSGSVEGMMRLSRSYRYCFRRGVDLAVRDLGLEPDAAKEKEEGRT